MVDIELVLAEINRGVEELISEEELLIKLRERRPLYIKLGFDPTAPDIHLGHVVILNKLRIFQNLGHKVKFLVGDFTAMIGDPSGKNCMRPRLNKTDILKNSTTYKEQIFKILDPKKTDVFFNSSWLSKLDSEGIILLASKHTVARMLERDDFKSRYMSAKPIFIHEFIYPLLQGYDSVILHSDIELGGIDQKFNLLMGRELQKIDGQRPQIVLMMPLLLGLDGKQKMSKSACNYIGISEPPNEMFGKIMSISDNMMWNYYELLSLRSLKEINQLKTDVKFGKNPRDIKILLAKELVSRFHSKSEASLAEDKFIDCFQKKKIPNRMPEFKYALGLPIKNILKESKLCVSTSDALRMIQQGAVRIDGQRITDIMLKLNTGTYIFQVGRRRFACVRIK
ncbi:tyrosine--tRNA ligase [Candidatus Photodesmus anomalopis]|uniref:tyrosine--tRNA ligase n=1 Tax=Candidatus Photodesmus anomalopis TaxID=28176 RepID=UPI00058EC540|nr:tyrosine--tRNA ligase [Candidatus Photodesmus katoptron]